MYKISAVDKKRVLAPSFFIFIALFLALLISTISGYVFWWVGICALLIIYIFWSECLFPLNLLSASVLAFISILVISELFISPAFTQEGIYFIAWFAVSFFVFSRLPEDLIRVFFGILVAMFVFLSVWAWFQFLTNSGYLVSAGHRVNTIFFTPNTFAAALNLVLLPLIALYINSSKGYWLLMVIVMLFGALLITQSRGGMVSFSCSVLFLAAVYKFANLIVNKGSLKKLALSMIAVFMLVGTVQLIKINNPDTSLTEDITKITRTGTVSSLQQRWIMYGVAWNLIKEKPFIGHGYNTFRYYWLRDQQGRYIGSGTRFVHNDYLQIWMETGILGLLFLCAVIVLFYYFGLKKILYEKSGIEYWSMLLAGLTAYFLHALVDFVMYPPVLLLIFGAYLGVASQLVSNGYQKSPGSDCFQRLLQRLEMRPQVLRGLVCLLLMFWLSQPAIAQLAFDEANRRVRALKVPEALPLYELARRFAPYEPEYYRFEASIWAHATEAGNFKESAEKADKLFAEGAAANPLDVNNLLSRALLERDHGELLKHPVDLATILDWMKYVLSWRPHNTFAQAEYIRTLFMSGNTELAELKYREWKRKYPKSIYLKNLEKEYGLW